MYLKKMSNGFYPNAKEDTVVVVASSGIAGFLGLLSAKKMLGGLWVGGTCEITDEGVRFSPNGLNKIFHKKGSIDPVLIPMQDIRSVAIAGGWVTKIIAITHKGGEFRFRCYGARAIAKELSAHLSTMHARQK